MDIKLLNGADDVQTSMSIEAFASMAARKKRRESFYRSLLRCFSICVVFITFGCYIAINGADNILSFLSNGSTAEISFISISKRIFLLSIIPSLSFVTGACRLYRFADTVLPASYGLLFGMHSFKYAQSLTGARPLSLFIPALIYFIYLLFVLCIYSVFCAVCASYGECRKRTGVTDSDRQNLFTYFMTCLSCAAVSSVVAMLLDKLISLIF